MLQTFFSSSACSRRASNTRVSRLAGVVHLTQVRVEADTNSCLDYFKLIIFESEER